MRFRFCGDLDCPDWVLAEISILSKLTSVKMKMLCVQVLKSLLGNEIDYEKVYKLTSDAKFESGDVKASIAALTFIMTSAAKYDCEDETLSNELQQLGLPKEHATSLCKSYSDAFHKLQEEFRNQSLRVSKLESVQWRVDYILSSSELKDVSEPSVQVKLQVKNPDNGDVKPVAFTVSAAKFRVLLNELRQASSMMENLKS
ncbi:COMM domain-containing protein 4-like isoform X2 [Littorina saxatilis]|uniref:COMM domain-containing protein 4-like isoform X2 n=1 Tax=Littorina saxatilis TaxID=31220 RepID=UPI0038B51928